MKQMIDKMKKELKKDILDIKIHNKTRCYVTIKTDSLLRVADFVYNNLKLRFPIATGLDTGEELPGEFVYLPLLLGGLIVAEEIVMQDEDVHQSSRMLAKVKASKAELFAGPDLRELNTAFDHILAQRARQ